METYAPAAVLINRKHECLYSLGPTDRYLRVAPGHADARSARHGAPGHAYQAAVGDPAGQSGECARHRRRRPDQPQRRPAFIQHRRPAGGRATARSCCWFALSMSRRCSRSVACSPCRTRCRASGELEQELEATRTELQGAIRNLEISGEEQKGDQRRGAVGQRGIPIDQRGVADLEGGTAVAQRGAHRPQWPVAGNAGAAAHHLQRSAKRSVQHRASRRSSSIPTSISASSPLPPRRCSTSFPATSAGRWRTSIRWLPTVPC